MEVHPPHTHQKPKKKWSEHLFEFLMLFLAVFAGFVAENLREGMIERHRTRQYVEFLKRDLKVDVSNLNYLCTENSNLINAFDSLIQRTNEYPRTKNITALYYYFNKTHSYFTFLHTSRAIDQLEHSGQMRLLSDINLADTISAYYENVKGLEQQGGIYMEYYKLYNELALKIFEYSQFEAYRQTPLAQLNNNFSLITASPELLKEFCNKIALIRIILDDYTSFMKFLREGAKSTLQYLDKNYPS